MAKSPADEPAAPATDSRTVRMSPDEAPVAPAGSVVVGAATDASPSARTEPADRLTAATAAARQRAEQASITATVPAYPAAVTEQARRKVQAMTRVAGAGLSMAATFKAAFASALPGWRAELAEPAGPSTGGGEQAAQPISIIAPEGGRLAIGRVDPARRTVTFRSFDYVAAMHRQRFGRPVALRRDDYERFIRSVTVMFSGAGLAIEHETAVAGAGVDRAGPSAALWILLALFALVAVALLIYSHVAAPR